MYYISESVNLGERFTTMDEVTNAKKQTKKTLSHLASDCTLIGLYTIFRLPILGLQKLYAMSGKENKNLIVGRQKKKKEEKKK